MEEEEGDYMFLDAEEAKPYRGMVASGMYLVQDRTGIRFAIKELSSAMANPRVRDQRRLERFARYLKGRERG